MSYGKATKKPVTIHFFKWAKNKAEQLREWVETFDQKYGENFTATYDDTGATLQVKTLEGSSYDVPEGYIIIRGVQGEYYPCEPKIFNQTYDVVTLHSEDKT